MSDNEYTRIVTRACVFVRRDIRASASILRRHNSALSRPLPPPLMSHSFSMSCTRRDLMPKFHFVGATNTGS